MLAMERKTSPDGPREDLPSVGERHHPQLLRDLPQQEPMGGNARGRHSLSAVAPHRPSTNVRISPPEHLARLQRLNLAPSSVSRSGSRGRDDYRFTCFVFRCRIRSPTTCICSTSSSVISTPTNWSSIASINSTRSNK